MSDTLLVAAIGVGLLAVVLAGDAKPKLRQADNLRRLWATALNPSRSRCRTKLFLYNFYLLINAGYTSSAM